MIKQNTIQLFLFAVVAALFLTIFAVFTLPARAGDPPAPPAEEQEAPVGEETAVDDTPAPEQESSGQTDAQTDGTTEETPKQTSPPLTTQNEEATSTLELETEPAATSTPDSETATTTTEASANETSEDGEGGSDGADTPQGGGVQDGEPADIETGDATSTAEVITESNTTEVDTPEEAAASGGSNNDITVSVDSGLLATTTASSTSITGENEGFDPDGVFIKTGDGNALGYILNAFNVAITNSSGSILFLRNPLASMLDLTKQVMDIFDDITEGESDCSLMGCKVQDALFSFLGNNVAEVENDLYVGCNSGKNSGTSTEGYVGIETGNCNSSGIVLNFGNLFIADSRYLVILVNNVGDLKGNIVLPDASFFQGLNTGASLGRGSSLFGDNTVEVENNGTTTALTGSNVASSTEPSLIDTGNANAKTAVANFVNQIGAPICFIIAVGGEWNGDIYQLPPNFTRESTPFGEFVCGSGMGDDDTGRENFHASTTNYAKVLNNAIVEAITGDNNGSGLAVAMQTGDANAFLYILNVLNQTIIGQDWIFGLFTVSGDWDGDLIFGVLPSADPVDQVAGQLVSKKSKGITFWGVDSEITMQKSVSVSTTTSPSTITYSITINNNGGKLYNVKLADTLKNPSGVPLHTETWNLDTIEAGEVVKIDYKMKYSGNLTPGLYTNTAKLTGRLNSEDGLNIKPVMATAMVEILPGAVLGLETENTCPAYLTSFVGPSEDNNPEQVRLLEVFLRDSQGEAVVPDGVYDEASIEAVKRFQEKNSEEILTPWGMESGTGRVYYTTQKKINELYCRGYTEFALTSLQLAEIVRYRSFRLGSSPLLPVMRQELMSDGEAIFDPLVENVLRSQTVDSFLPHLAQKPNSSMFASFVNGLLGWMRTFVVIPFAKADVTVSNSSTVISNTSASASSGGQSAAGGESVRSGGSKASVNSSVISDDSGTSVYIEKTENGSTSVETYTKPPHEPVVVEASVTAKSAGETLTEEAHASVDLEVSSTPEEGESPEEAESQDASFSLWGGGFINTVIKLSERLLGWFGL